MSSTLAAALLLFAPSVFAQTPPPPAAPAAQAAPSAAKGLPPSSPLPLDPTATIEDGVWSAYVLVVNMPMLGFAEARQLVGQKPAGGAGLLIRPAVPAKGEADHPISPDDFARLSTFDGLMFLVSGKHLPDTMLIADVKTSDDTIALGKKVIPCKKVEFGLDSTDPNAPKGQPAKLTAWLSSDVKGLGVIKYLVDMGPMQGSLELVGYGTGAKVEAGGKPAEAKKRADAWNKAHGVKETKQAKK